MGDFLFRGSLGTLDPLTADLASLEAERQARKLIMIPSESTAPLAVREALATAFQNIYAEGYPDEDTRQMPETELADYAERLAYYRRYADPRYYKGVEYADPIEALARRRCADVFAANGYSANQLFVNVQPLSGAPANNAVYTALLNPGDTIMGMNLLHGGHLTHGSPANRSGKLFNVVGYTVHPETEQIDYDALASQAVEAKPKILIAGYSSYPWVPDWARFRQIADAAGAILLADVSHIAGLIAAGEIPSPVGHAQIITFTTHKTLCGPRGAVILTTDSGLARKLDRAVFPGEQGGPHVHVFAALALTFKLAQTEQFKQLQHQIVLNCATLASQIQACGLRIPFGGTNTHLLNIDCKSVAAPDGAYLSGDMAARILDLAGIVCNRNTIPGDASAFSASGIRLGTPWITQRGLVEADMVEIANIIADVLFACTPYTVEARKGPSLRAKVDFAVLENAKLRTRVLAEKAGLDFTPTRSGYPHHYYIDDTPGSQGKWTAYLLKGRAVRSFVNYVFASEVEALEPGGTQATQLNTPQKQIDGYLTWRNDNYYRFDCPTADAALAAAWLRALSDGYATFDADLKRRIPGPVVVEEITSPGTFPESDFLASRKPFFIGCKPQTGDTLPTFQWQEQEAPLRRTPLYEYHKTAGAKMVPFAGWEMPVWYSSVVEEHLATRQTAGLFDVTHMGVFQAEGIDAAAFLDSVCGNDISGLEVGESCYTHFLDPQANVIDDLLVYRRAEQKYMVVVNAANDDKDWAWLNAVRSGAVLLDLENPGAKAYGCGVRLRNLRDVQASEDMRVDIALQGPKSRDILLALGVDKPTRQRIMTLKRTELCDAMVGGFDLVVSRTGYTGEKMAFELFIHPERALDLWKALLRVGEGYGIKPCGLGARDSLRTEAGLPLYGHEMGGELNLGVGEAGFGSYVKVYKPWFIGRSAFLRREEQRSTEVIRFRFVEKAVRMAHLGDPVLDKKGRTIGMVTSCAIDKEGYLTGQALIEEKYAVESTPLHIYQSAPSGTGKAPDQLQIGDRVVLPTLATVISRFPKL